MEDMPDIEFNVVLTGKEMTFLILILGHHADRTGATGSKMLRIKLKETIDDFQNVRR